MISLLNDRADLTLDDIHVSDGMIEAGLAVLEEVDELPVSHFRLERAFQAMCVRALQEEARANTDLSKRACSCLLP